MKQVVKEAMEGQEDSEQIWEAEESFDFNEFRRSARWRLQHKRQILNQRIQKQAKLRDGAENLMKAVKVSSDRKLKQQAGMELSFANSQLETLRQELESINSTLDVYQFERSTEHQLPMIPLGLRETKELEYKIAFKDFLLEHYSVDGSEYEEELDRLAAQRKAACSPSRDEDGINTLHSYYSQLFYVEKRFFSQKGLMPVYFYWHDSFTGILKVQRTVAFEKASILFNIGALWTQIAAKKDRSTKEGAREAASAFQKAAGVFKYIKENFVNSPSVDMTQDLLTMVVALMLAQAQICLWEERFLEGMGNEFQDYISMAQECSEISQCYKKVQMLMNTGLCMNCVPVAWNNVIQILYCHFKAQSHYFTAVGLQHYPAENANDPSVKEFVWTLYLTDPDNPNIRASQVKAHLKTAVRNGEDSLRMRQVCRICRKIPFLEKFLVDSRDQSVKLLMTTEQTDEFNNPVSPTPVKVNAKCRAEPVAPILNHRSVDEIFRRLGPLVVFNAENQWSVPREVTLHRGADGYGLSVIGSAPIMIQSLDRHGPAVEAGIGVGDIIVSVNGKDVKWEKHDTVVGTIRAMKEKVTFKLVTPQSLTDTASRCNLKLAKTHGKENGHQASDCNGTVSSDSSVKSKYSMSTGSIDSLNERMSTDHSPRGSKSNLGPSSISNALGAVSASDKPSTSQSKTLVDADLW